MLQGWVVSLLNPSLGDLLGLIGLALSLVGFGLTYWQARRSATAAIAAKQAAEDTRRVRRVIDVTVELIDVLEGLKGLKDIVQSQHWDALPQRIDAVCRGLIAVHSSMSEDGGAGFTQGDAATLLAAKTTIREMEVTLTSNGAKPPSTERGIRAVTTKIVVPLGRLHDDIYAIQRKAQNISTRK